MRKPMEYFHHRYMERYGKDIKKICEPFFISRELSYFVYQKIQNNGLFTSLNTNPDYSGYYMDLDLFDDDILLRHPDNIPNKTLVLSSSLLPVEEESPSYDKIIQLAIKKFNYDHALVYIQKHPDFCEIFYFATHPKNKKIINSYVSNFNQYKLFTKYFLLEASSYIRRMELDPINLSKEKKNFFEKPSIKIINDEFEISEMAKKILKHHGLTEAESNCLIYLSQGFTAKEVAIIKKLSQRTVETHLQSIKSKLNIHSKSRLIRWFHECIM